MHAIKGGGGGVNRLADQRISLKRTERIHGFCKSGGSRIGYEIDHGLRILSVFMFGSRILNLLWSRFFDREVKVWALCSLCQQGAALEANHMGPKWCIQPLVIWHLFRDWYWAGPERPIIFPKNFKNIVYLIKSIIKVKACYTVINFR